MRVRHGTRVCIYCGQGESTVLFTGREHVVPELLGSFQNNLTLVGWVCNHCNTTVFGPLETRFKEDTYEGITCQMLNFSDSAEIRVRNGALKYAFDLGFGDPFFSQTFPLLTFRDGDWKLLFVPQIKIRGYGEDGFIVVLIDKVRDLPRDGKRFRKLKNALRNAKSKDTSIFVHRENEEDKHTLARAVELARELGIDYKPGEEKSMPFVGDGTDSKKQAHVSVDVTIGFDVARVIAKIAFNYFAYCAIASGQEDVLYHENFSRIKDYILGKHELPIREVIPETQAHRPLLFEEREGGMRLVGHILTFCNNGGNLIAELSFVGRLVYTVNLGKVPESINRPELGNGHLFDPVRHEMHGLTRNPAKRGSGLPLSFDLFNNNE